MADSSPVNVMSLPESYKLTIDYRQYHTSEQMVIIPFLLEHGIIPIDGVWYDIERDSSGPLIRGLRVRFPNGLEGEVYYG